MRGPWVGVFHRSFLGFVSMIALFDAHIHPKRETRKTRVSAGNEGYTRRGPARNAQFDTDTVGPAVKCACSQNILFSRSVHLLHMTGTFTSGTTNSETLSVVLSLFRLTYQTKHQPGFNSKYYVEYLSSGRGTSIVI